MKNISLFTEKHNSCSVQDHPITKTINKAVTSSWVILMKDGMRGSKNATCSANSRHFLFFSLLSPNPSLNNVFKFWDIQHLSMTMENVPECSRIPGSEGFFCCYAESTKAEKKISMQVHLLNKLERPNLIPPGFVQKKQSCSGPYNHSHQTGPGCTAESWQVDYLLYRERLSSVSLPTTGGLDCAGEGEHYRQKLYAELHWAALTFLS